MSDVPSNLIPTRITQLPDSPVASEDGLLLFIYQGVSYKIRAGDLLSVAGVPNSRQVIAGTGMTGGGALSNNVTLSIAVGGVGTDQLASSGVTQGSYGSATSIPVFTVDATGRVVSATSVAIQVDGYVPETRQVIAGTGLTGGGALNNNITLDVEFSDVTPLPVENTGSAGTANTASRSDHKHPSIDLSSASEVDNLLGISNGGTARSLVMEPGAVIWSGADGLYVGPAGGVGQVLVSGGVAAPTWGSAVIVAPVPANNVYAGPASGGSADPIFRPLVVADVPTLNQDTTGTASNVTDIVTANHGGTGASTLTGYVYGNGTGTMTASTTIPYSALTGLNTLTIGTGLTGVSYNGSTPVTVAIDSTVVTLTGSQNLTNKTLTSPVVKNNFKFEAAGITSYTQFTSALGSWIFNSNQYQEVYLLNQNNGSDASADYVIYNDASDVNSYFIDMGMNSSNYSSVTYPIFTANSGYLFTGGGLTGQASDLFIGTSNPASDVVFFSGDVQTSSVRGRFKGNTGNLLLGTATDTGQMLQVQGTSKFTGASSFSSTVALSADPTLALQAATKQYVDGAVSTGFVVHTAVRLATSAALPANTYNNGASGVGATLTAVATGVLTINGSTANVNNRVLIKNEATQANNGVYTVTVAGAVGVAYVLTRVTDFDVVGAGEIANNAYFFVNAGGSNAGSSFVLSQLAAITVGTTALPFTEFASQLVYTGGTNIDVTGQVVSLTGTVAATNGGTGTATVTTGDLLYGSATNTWSKLPLGIAYKSLIINAAGTQVEWNAIPLNQITAVSGQLNVSNGGTGVSTLSGLAYGNGTSPFTAATAAQVVAVIGSTAVANATTAVNIAGGAASCIPYQTGVGATAFIANGTAGQVLTSAGAGTPVWSGISGGVF